MQTVLKSYIQASVTYIVLFLKNVWQLLERKRVVCCKDLSTGHALMTVETWYSLAHSFELFHVSVRGAGKICCCNALSCRTYRSRYTLLSREATHSHQHAGQLVPLWDGGTKRLLWRGEKTARCPSGAVVIQSSLGASRFYQFCLWVLTYRQRHLTARVNSGWFWKMCALIQMMKWPTEASRTTDGKTNFPLTHVITAPQATMRTFLIWGFSFIYVWLFSLLIPLIQVPDGLVCYKNLWLLLVIVMCWWWLRQCFQVSYGRTSFFCPDGLSAYLPATRAIALTPRDLFWCV